MSFGSYPAQTQNALTLAPTYVANNRPLMTKIMGIADLRTAYLAEYCDLHTDFTNTYLDPRIDSIATLIGPHVSADANKQFTLEQFTANITGDITVSGGGPGGSQALRGLKSFITQRNTSLASSLDCVLSSVADAPVLNALHIYPNPTADVLFIELPKGASMKDLQLTDALGRRVDLRTTGNSVDVSHLPAGLYNLMLVTGNTPVVTRVEKQ